MVGFGVRLAQEPGQVDVQEGRDVTEVEQTDVTEVDRFLVKQAGRNHSHRDHVPGRPGGFPIGDGGDRGNVGIPVG